MGSGPDPSPIKLKHNEVTKKSPWTPPLSHEKKSGSMHNSTAIHTVYIYYSCFTGPFVGWLLDRFTIRQVTLCGALVATCGFVISTFAESVEVLIITYGIVGGNLITRITQIIFDIATRLQASCDQR